MFIWKYRNALTIRSSGSSFHAEWLYVFVNREVLELDLSQHPLFDVLIGLAFKISVALP